MCATADEQVVYATWKRRLLAGYIDFVLFNAICGVGHHFIEQVPTSLMFKLLLFAPVEACLIAASAVPGRYILSIRGGAQGRLTVDPAVWRRESWLTMLLGVLFLLEGGKMFVRWSLFAVPPPIFGFVPSHSVFTVLSLATGLLMVVTACYVLKMRLIGLWLALALLVVFLVSTTASWSLWDEYVQRYVISRSEYLVRPVDHGLMQFLQWMMPEMQIVYLSLLLICYGLTRNRFDPAYAGARAQPPLSPLATSQGHRTHA